MRILDAEAFAGHFVLEYRKDGLTGLAVHPITDGVPSASGTPIEFDEPIYSVGTGGNPEYTTDRVRLGYGSMVTPSSVYDYDIKTAGLTLLKRQPVLGDFDPADYEQRRVWATAEDGTRVPISSWTARACSRTAPRPACSTGTARTRRRWTRTSRSPG